MGGGAQKQTQVAIFNGALSHSMRELLQEHHCTSTTDVIRTSVSNCDGTKSSFASFTGTTTYTLHANTLHANTNPVFACFQWLH